PHPEKSDAVVPVALVEPEPIEAFAPVVAPAVSAPRTTPVKAVAHADGARRATAAPTAAPPSGGSAQTARPAASAPKTSDKPGVAPAKKNLNPAPRSAPGRTSAGPVSAAPAGRTADSVRPGAAQQSSATRSKRMVRTAPAAAQRVTPPAMPPATQRVTPPIAPPAAKTPVSEQAHPVVESPVVPAPSHPEPIAPIVEPSVGSGMEQMVTKLALDQTALQVEHSTGSALEHLAGLYEQPAYSSGAAHAAEYSSDSFAPTMQQATPHVATEASIAAAAATADVPIAWVAAPAAPASAPATPQPAAPATGASYITLFVAPISFLLFAGGAGLLAYGMLHNMDAGDNEMLKLDLRLQNMSYCMLGGFSLIAGLLGFVAAGMAHLAGAVRRGK
ncbi:MAG: hypothetical protein JWL69_668, partial [Phycisphaerales bacterium]|nr:hypothetical protein [Phycisphaerales bacterium]